MRFLIMVATVWAGCLAGAAIVGQRWPEFWAWFGIWAVGMLVLLVTRKDT